MRLFRVVLAVAMTAAAAAALATPQIANTFAKVYNVKAGSALAKLNCAGCHTTAPKLNPYGADLKKVMGKSKTPTAAMFKKIESLDSDKDGVKNGAEIKAGTNPGDPKSKPAAPKKGGKAKAKK